MWGYKTSQVKSAFKSGKGLLLFAVAIIFSLARPASADDLQKFSNVQLIDDPANDGDSFLVKAGDKTYHLRLYFVDCPETSASIKDDAERIREQARYFGITDKARIIYFGKEVKAFTEKALEKPFTKFIPRSPAPSEGRPGAGFMRLLPPPAGMIWANS